jgi:ABC-2 type transport system ATP-binding protein/lipopolysaccharide transport system ATP-binding protein
MATPTIQVAGVSKRYLLGEHHGRHGSLRDTLSSSIRSLLGREKLALQEIWSLRDVSLEVEAGQALGIIGRNGAGKSTLLKLIAHITEPTAGAVRTRGRVGSLLEVGTGFHPELTGRENVYLNGAILGMRRRQVAARFDEIADFAGPQVRRFLETPVKRYSSGMYLRLAFAVAAHLEADIMAIDEVLAVGDVEFQRKCLGKMSNLESEGRTVVFVSHDLNAVTKLCSTAVWLDEGRVQAYGPSRAIVDAYIAAGVEPLAERVFPDRPDEPVSPRRATVLNARGDPAATLDREQPFELELRFVVRERVADLDFAVFIENLRGVRVLDEAWSETAVLERGEPGEFVARIAVPPVLTAGDYAVGFWLGSAYDTLFYEEEVVRLRLEGDVKGRPNRIVQLGLSWDVRRLDEPDGLGDGPPRGSSDGRSVAGGFAGVPEEPDVGDRADAPRDG